MAESKNRTVIEPLAELNIKPNIRSFSSIPINITSLAISPRFSAPERFIYAGTLAGALFLLSLNASTNNLSIVKFTIISNGFPVISICCVGHAGKVIALSGDGSLYLLDSLLQEPTKRINIKGEVSGFCRRFFSKDYNFEMGFLSRSNRVKGPERRRRKWPW